MNSLLTFTKQFVAVVFIFSSIFAPAALAQESVVLTLTSASEDMLVELTEEDLLSIEQHSIFTENEFVDGLVEFTGPLVRDVVALLADLEIEALILTAVNDYAVEIPVSDIIDYDVIFALTQDGERFSARDKGPIWVIYPMTDHIELQDRVYNDRLIWQLVRVEAL
jgi:hypothetical protein